jgi:hypothetical protein
MGCESASDMATKEFCGAARPSERKGREFLVPFIAPRNYSLGDLQIGLILRLTASKARMLENHAAERRLDGA